MAEALPRETGRYSKVFKEEVLAQVRSGRKGVEVCRQYGIPGGTLYRWKRASKENDGSVPEAKSTRPLSSGASPIDEEHRRLVLSIKEKLPNAGLAQVQNQLKRFHGVKLSRPMIGRIFTEAGIPLQKKATAEPSDPANNRFEMTRPGELWAVDFKEMWIQSTKTYGLFVLDDYSRFCVGHAVTEKATADLAIETVEKAMQRYGRPERILSDRGPQFHAWNGVSKFDAFLADFLVDHTVTKAGHCFTNGKIEAFNRSIEAELLDVEEFASLEEAKRAITTWIRHYNFHRTHMGIDGLMPADRYFGLVEEARRAMTTRLKTLGSGLRWLRGLVSEDGAALRAPTVFQVVCRGDKLEMVVLGRRFTLG
jgi:putative transposase